ncbi:MAG TPA: multiheme c-type cytochrome [Acidobacteriaceae bacterium]|nr:multiheme c-type cytochrome [Acidobacteriaceae bacterium]
MASASLALLLALLAFLAPAAPDTVKTAGDAACLSCHQAQSTYVHTAHALTSQPASKESILGSFHEGSNVLMIADPATASDNPGLYFKMEARPNGFFQTAFAGWPGQLKTRSEKMEIVIGSGVRGQSYLYWHGDRLFELPVSYWSDGNRWINSPGYKDGTMNFSRAVVPRCLECHATSIRASSPDPLGNQYDPESLVLGISCERCHGPGARHIALEQAKAPGASEAILNPAKFSRDRQVDLCALCHNGIRTDELVPAFSYVLGKPLDNYLRPTEGAVAAHPDVHGNQVGLLEKSRCYLSSPNMSCLTCHDVHQAERTAATYSARCLSCHKVESCGMAKTMGPRIAENCIDCHMPVEPTNAIASVTAGQTIRPNMRNHWIKVYP